MNTKLTLREEVQELYTNTGFHYALSVINECNTRYLEAFKKLASTLDLKKNQRARYVVDIQKTKVDGLIRIYAEEDRVKRAKRILGSARYEKRHGR